jgi:hypothetical protein
MLEFLVSVKSWTMSYYDSPKAKAALTRHPTEHLPLLFRKKSSHRQTVGCTMRLLIDLLRRGHGVLAGRMARKAFLQLEELFVLEPPALLWNMTELFHYVLVTNQATLFYLMLSHLRALAKDRMPSTHPVAVLLRALQQVMVDLKNEHLGGECCPPDLTKSAAVKTVIDALSPLIARGWSINADILFDRYDTRLFEIYTNIHWYACSIEPPAALVRAATEWFEDGNVLTMDYTSPFAIKPGIADVECTAVGLDSFPTLAQRQLYTRSINVLRKRGQDLVRRQERDSPLLLPILAGLTCAKVGDMVSSGYSTLEDADGIMTSRQLQAGVTACIIRTLLDVMADSPDDPDAPTGADLLEHLRYVIELREYHYEESNPQTILEMLLLRDELLSQRLYDQADEVENRAFEMLEEFVDEIPVDSA